jgi:hypothetical protein
VHVMEVKLVGGGGRRLRARRGVSAQNEAGRGNRDGSREKSGEHVHNGANCSQELHMKKILLLGIVVAALGWIPTIAMIAQTRTPVKVTRIYTGPDGKTKVEEYDIPLKGQGRGTELSETVTVENLQFRRTNQDYYADWHPAPRRQYVVTLSGESEIELEGGRKIRLGPGHILLAEDTTGQGHISRAVGSKDRISLFITLADGAKTPR